MSVVVARRLTVHAEYLVRAADMRIKLSFDTLARGGGGS